MLETSARLLRLLTLLQSRREWSGADLAERLEVSPRTVRRDAERLRALGYPVHATPGTAGGYRLGAGAALPPLLLDDDEAVAVAVGLRTAAGGTVQGMEESSLRALGKLEQVLPMRLRQRVTALQSAVTPFPGGGPTVDPAVLATIAVACREQQRLRFTYQDNDGTASQRRVEPYRLVHTGRRWYLVAWDTGRRDWRTFRVDRLTLGEQQPSRFVPREPPHEDIAAYVSQRVSSAPYAYQGRFQMQAPATALAERVTPTAAHVEALDEHTSLLTAGSYSPEALVYYVAMLGIDFQVLDPPDLIEQTRALVNRLQRALPPAGAT